MVSPFTTRLVMAFGVSAALFAVPSGALAAPDAAAQLAAKITTARALITKRGTEAEQAKAKAEPLSTDRKAKDKDRGTQQASFDKHAKAGAAALKKFETASQKSDPKAGESLETSRTELQAASADGATLTQTTKALRAQEDALAELVRASADGATEAKTASADVKSASDELVKLCTTASADAARGATDARSSLGKLRTKAGIASKDAFAKARDKAAATDQTFATSLTDAEKALAEVNAVVAARKAAPPTPVAGGKPKPQESLFAKGVSATGVQTGGDGRSVETDEQRRHRSTQAPTRPGAERKKP